MSWDAVLIDFENTLADLTRGRSLGEAPEYYAGGPGVDPVLDGSGVPVGNLLAALSRRCVPWAVVSSSPVVSVLGWFDRQGWQAPAVCVGFGGSTLHRPSSDPLLAALGRLGVPPSPAVLSLGDSTSDIQAAYRAGVTSASLRSQVPVQSVPDLLLAEIGAVFDVQRQHRLVGDRSKTGPLVSLALTADGHELRIGGRILDGWGAALDGDPDGCSGLAQEVARGRRGRWPGETVELAQTILMHAQNGKPGGARLTWIPDRTLTKGPIERLARRLAGLASLPCHSLLRQGGESPRQSALPPGERRGAMAGRFTATAALDGETVLVLDDVRVSGATLTEAARALLEAGAGRVVGLVLGQAALAGPGPMATWGPTRSDSAEEEAERCGQGLFF